MADFSAASVLADQKSLREIRATRALRNLVQSLTDIEGTPRFQEAWEFLHDHGFVYSGPNWDEALTAARKALASIDKWACGHRSGGVCCECYYWTLQRVNELERQTVTLRDENGSLRRRLEDLRTEFNKRSKAKKKPGRKKRALRKAA
jgi:hypothetical protein